MGCDHPVDHRPILAADANPVQIELLAGTPCGVALTVAMTGVL